MKLPRSVRALVCSVVAACALSIPEARAALLAYEPFDYSPTPGVDVNNDGRADLSGLNGGMGFKGGWIEGTFGTDAAAFPFDYIQAGSLGVPTESFGLSTLGNSLRSVNAVGSGMRQTYLERRLTDVFEGTDGSTLWFSILVQKEVNHVAGGRDSETFSIQLLNFARSQSVRLDDSPGSRNYGIVGLEGNQVSLADVGPTSPGGGILSKPDLLVLKLSFLPGGDILQLFVNPTLGAEPVSPNASLTLSGAGLSDVETIVINSGDNSNYRTEWSFDEIRVGTTYSAVTVPEPSSLLLAGFGLGAAGLTRLRRNRAA